MSFEKAEIDSRYSNLAIYVSSILANCCDSKEKQEVLYGLRLVDLVLLTLSSKNEKMLQASLDLFSALVRDNLEISRLSVTKKVESGLCFVDSLFEMLKSGFSKDVKLVICVCVANIVKSGAISEDDSRLKKILLPCLVEISLGKDDTSVRAPLIISYLLSDSENLQEASMSCGTVGVLAINLNEADALDKKSSLEYGSGRDAEGTVRFSDQLREAAFLALATVCNSKDDCRKIVSCTSVLVSCLPIMYRHLSQKSLTMHLLPCVILI